MRTAGQERRSRKARRTRTRLQENERDDQDDEADSGPDDVRVLEEGGHFVVGRRCREGKEPNSVGRRARAVRGGTGGPRAGGGNAAGADPPFFFLHLAPPARETSTQAAMTACSTFLPSFPAASGRKGVASDSLPTSPATCDGDTRHETMPL